MKKMFFNPFVYIAGARALVIGLAAMMVTGVIGYFSHTHFDGVIEMHQGHISPLIAHLAEQIVAWLSMTVVFYLIGVIFSTSKIRIVDVAGTMALSRWVTIFSAIIGFGIHMPDQMPKMTSELIKLMTPQNMMFSILSAVFMIWMVALIYNAFSVSCNLKGGKSVWTFIVGLIVSDLIAVLIIRNYII